MMCSTNYYVSCWTSRYERGQLGCVLRVGSGPAQRMGNAPCDAAGVLHANLIVECMQIAESPTRQLSPVYSLVLDPRCAFVDVDLLGTAATRLLPFAATVARGSHGIGLHSLITRLPRLIRSRRAEIDTFAAMLVGDARRTPPLCHQQAYRRVGCDLGD